MVILNGEDEMHTKIYVEPTLAQYNRNGWFSLWFVEAGL